MTSFRDPLLWYAEHHLESLRREAARHRQARELRVHTLELRATGLGDWLARRLQTLAPSGRTPEDAARGGRTTLSEACCSEACCEG